MPKATMSSGFGDNPFSEFQGEPHNPYSSPQVFEPKLSGPPLVEAAKAKARPPAYGLCFVGGVGMIASILAVILSVVLPAAGGGPGAENDLFALVFNPDAASFQVIFFFVNLTIAVGGYQMSVIKLRPMAYIASILAMLNCGSLCCILGLPIGIWSIVILSQSDVARAFEENY